MTVVVAKPVEVNVEVYVVGTIDVTVAVAEPVLVIVVESVLLDVIVGWVSAVLT